MALSRAAYKFFFSLGRGWFCAEKRLDSRAARGYHICNFIEETDDVEGQMKFDAGKDNTKEIIKQLCSMDMTQVTPMEAFTMLHELTLKANGVK